MDKFNVNYYIRYYLDLLDRACDDNFNRRFTRELSEVRQGQLNLIQARLIFKSFLKEDKEFFIYFDAKTSEIAVNEFIGQKNYIQKDHSFEVSVYRKTLSKGARSMEVEEQRSGAPLQNLYELFISESNKVNKYFDQKKISIALAQDGAIEFLGLSFPKKYDNLHNSWFTLSFLVSGNVPLEIKLSACIDPSSRKGRALTASGQGLEYKDVFLDKNPAEEIRKLLHLIISAEEQNSRFKYNSRQEIPFYGLNSKVENDQKAMRTLGELSMWSANQTSMEDFDAKGILNKKTEEELLEANAEISFILKNLKSNLNKEKPLMDDFLSLWEQDIELNKKRLGDGFDVLSKQILLLKKNYLFHEKVFEELILCQQNILKKYLRIKEADLLAKETMLNDLKRIS